MKSNYLAARNGLADAIALGIAGFSMLWIALFNGYPLVYFDSGEYLVDSLNLAQNPYRSPIYPAFIRLASLNVTPWLVVICQCFLTLYVLRSVFAYVVRTESPIVKRIFFPGLIVFLGLATTLPWYVGQIMPDIFTGLAVLCAFLLLYDNDLPLEKAILFALLFALAVAVHLSNFLTVPLVLLGILVLRLFNRTRQLWPTCSLNRFVAFILSPVLAMVGILCLSNWRAAHEFRFSAAGPMFLLGRLIDNGMARDYLIHECRTEPLAACKYLNNLPDGNNFLWGSHPLMQDMGGWYHGGIEANKIVYGTIRRYPLRFTIDCLKQTVAAFMVFSQQTENLPYPGFVKDLNRFFPGDGAKYLLTMQWRGWLSKLGNKLYPLYRFIFWVALITGLFFLVSGRGSERANQLMVMVLLLLIANAAVTGSISGVVNRYQARVNWMSSLCCRVYVILYLINRHQAHSLDMARRGLISPCGGTEKWSTGESHLTDDDAEMAPGQL